MSNHYLKLFINTIYFFIFLSTIHKKTEIHQNEESIIIYRNFNITYFL
ncbi:hypothetical protein CLU83_3540 [Flavobacterium sp. 1]|nr:hypothetical protein CLU83_3540 [Flavobacterium sp. 1]